MRNHESWGKPGRAAVLAALVVLVGCNGKPGTLETAPKQLVIGRLNSNAAHTDFLVKAKGDATFSFTQDGRKESHTAEITVLHRRPRKLYMKMEHALGGPRRVELGSNEEEFWMWNQMDPGRPVYYWGRHELMHSVEHDELPIRPDHLPSLTGLIDVPMLPNNPKDPIFRAEPEFYELLYLDETLDGEWYLYQSVRIDRRNPPFPNEILIYDPEGYPVMKAELSNYRPMAETQREIKVPHEIRAEWLKADARLKLEFNRVERFDKEEAEKTLILQTPLDQGKDVGIIERVDQVPLVSPGSPPSAEGSLSDEEP